MTPSAVAARTLVVAGILGTVGVHADAEIIYHNEFESSGAIGSEWNLHNRTTGALTGFLGRFDNQRAVVLTLGVPTVPPIDPPVDPPIAPITDLPTIGDGSVARADGHVWVYSLMFDLYVIDSWDGSDTQFGTDSLFTKINGVMLFNELFDNHHVEDNFRAPDDGPRNIGWAGWDDCVYRQIRIDFLVSSSVSALEFRWRSTADQGIEDESWGLDNVTFMRTLVSVPAPASVAPFGALALVARRRRRV